MHATQLIPDYQLLQCLGGGPMTVVYSARHLVTDSACAVKTLREDWEDQPTAIKLIQREAQAGLEVRHPHLVRVREAHVAAPPYFLVMDLLPGESLRGRLRREYCLEVAEAIWIARQTAEAVASLHRADLLHGDVKPDNLRLVEAGSVVLIDLGFAHHPGENEPLLRKGYVLGTANYLAPELCDSRPEEDLSSDLFSLGITLFEMLTGKLPYPPGSLTQTFRRHRCDPAADICHIRSDLPDDLAQLVRDLLQRHPNKRPAIAEVVQQLIDLEIAALRWQRIA
jgi:eukaryotic-like serine/threonine-protein kinase